MGPYSKLMIAALVLAGCATIPSVPTQNILMFSADGKLVDPTGNLNCAEGASSVGPQLHAYLKRRRRPAQLEAYARRLGWRFDATGRSFDFDQWADFPQFFPR